MRWALLLAAVLAPTAVPAAASASAASPASQAAYHRADRAVVSAATRLAHCQGKTQAPLPRCSSLQTMFQAAGLKLSAAQRRLPSASSASARAAATSSARVKAPALSVSGLTLTWNKVADVTTYVLVAKSSGRADQYSVVNGTSTRPAALAGATVSYSVRTAVTGSAWSKTVAIAYPKAADAQAAPALSVDGQTLRWTQVADATSYVLVTKVSGEADKYEQVNGTSATPAVRAGKSVRYSVRADVDGAAWAPEVTITYPAATSTGTTTTPAPSTGTTTPPASTPSTGDSTSSSSSTAQGFRFGLVSGSAILWQLPDIKTLGAKHVRMEFDINTPVSTMTPIIASYAKAGVKPLLLAGFSGRTPTDAEANNLATWAKAFGPDGTARGADWAAGTAVTEIEFGNESNQPWQYPSLNSDPNWANTSTYANIATQYATKFRTAATAVAAANSGVGLLAIADTPGRWAAWTDGLYRAVPNFSSYAKGWTVHPYGPTSSWQLDIDDAIAKMAAHGASSSIPVYVTEYGLATDNGHCLSDNYGWDRCMTYDAAATSLRSAVAAMRARYASRLAAVYLYSTSDLAAPGASTDREAYFGALRNDKSSKGAYTTEVRAELSASA
jgi:hypothetical protein